MVLTMGLRRSLALDANAEALVSDGARLTRRGMVDRVARLASVLRNLGMQDDDRVAMLAPNGQQYIEFYFGVLWGGGIVVPVNSRFALAEMIEQVRDAEPFALIVDKTFAEMGDALAQSVPSIRALMIVGETGASSRNVRSVNYEDALQSVEPVPDALRGEDDIACLFYTGGTTGRSKGVMLSHGNLWANAMATIAHLGLDDSLVHLHSGPLFHLGAGGRVYATAVAGGKHVVMSRFTPEQALSTIASERVTVATFVPTMLAMLLQLPDIHTYDLSSLRLITYGASPMPETVLQECLRRLPHVRFAQSLWDDRVVSGCDDAWRRTSYAECTARPAAFRRTTGLFRGGTHCRSKRPRIAARRNRRDHCARAHRDARLLAQTGTHGPNPARRLDAYRRFRIF